MLKKIIIVIWAMLVAFQFASCDSEAPTAKLDSDDGFEEIHVEEIHVEEIQYS